MSIANIDTFEHDISDEIKNKEASMGDIASATGDIGNTQQKTSHVSLLVITISIIILSTLIAGGLYGYMYYTEQQMIARRPKVTPQGPDHPTLSLLSVSPTLNESIGSFVTDVQYNKQTGYSMDLTSYSSVFSYMIKNEGAFADELARAVGAGRDMSTTTPPFTFTDVTLNNQNMRVGTSASSTVIYSFINTQALVIASTTEGILALRNAILR